MKTHVTAARTFSATAATPALDFDGYKHHFSTFFLPLLLPPFLVFSPPPPPPPSPTHFPFFFFRFCIQFCMVVLYPYSLRSDRKDSHSKVVGVVPQSYVEGCFNGSHFLQSHLNVLKTCTCFGEGSGATAKGRRPSPYCRDRNPNV